MLKTMTDAERFWPRAGDGKSADGCWEWIGMRGRGGYGRFAIGSRKDGTRGTIYAHRFAYEQIPRSDP